MKTDLEAAAELLSSAQQVLVMGHRNPEGDCIASTVAMGLICDRLGLAVTLYNDDPVPENLLAMPGSDRLVDKVETGTTFDLAVVVDCGALDRIGRGTSLLEGLPILNLDHHVTNTFFGHVNLVRPEASSATEVVHELGEQLGLAMDPSLAEVIYWGVLTDTGSFHYSNATAKAFHLAGDLVSRGVDPWAVSSYLYENQPIARLRLLAAALQTLEVGPPGTYASIVLSEETFRLTGAGSDLTDGLINYPRSLRGVEIAVQFREIERHHYKISLRSKGAIDVGALASRFGGGGHRNASGLELRGTLEEVKVQLYTAILDLC